MRTHANQHKWTRMTEIQQQSAQCDKTFTYLLRPRVISWKRKRAWWWEQHTEGSIMLPTQSSHICTFEVKLWREPDSKCRSMTQRMLQKASRQGQRKGTGWKTSTFETIGEQIKRSLQNDGNVLKTRRRQSIKHYVCGKNCENRKQLLNSFKTGQKKQ